MLACMFVSGAYNERYGDLKTELLNDKAKGIDNCPTSDDEAVQLPPVMLRNNRRGCM